MGRDLLPSYIDWKSSVKAFEDFGDAVFAEHPNNAQELDAVLPQINKPISGPLWCLGGHTMSALSDFATLLFSRSDTGENNQLLARFILCVAGGTIPADLGIINNDLNNAASIGNAVFSPETCVKYLSALKEIDRDVFCSLWETYVNEAKNSENYFIDCTYLIETPAQAFELVEGFVQLLMGATEGSYGVFFFWSD